MAINLVLGIFAGITLIFMVWLYYASGVRMYVGGQPMSPFVDAFAAIYFIVIGGCVAILMKRVPPDFELSAAFLPGFIVGGVLAIYAATQMHRETRTNRDAGTESPNAR